MLHEWRKFSLNKSRSLGNLKIRLVMFLQDFRVQMFEGHTSWEWALYRAVGRILNYFPSKFEKIS